MEKFNFALPDTIISDTIPIDDESFFGDTILQYADGADTIFQFNDSIAEADSMAMYFREVGSDIVPTNITIDFGSTSKTINKTLFGIHIGGMFDNSTFPNDGSSNYGWQWLIDLAPEILRFPGGAYAKFTHLLHNTDGSDAVGYGYDIYEIARYFDWTDGVMDCPSNEHIENDDPLELDESQSVNGWIEPHFVAEFINFRDKWNTQRCGDTHRYIDDLVELVHQINMAYPSKLPVKVVLDINILSETSTECRAIADYLKDHGVVIAGVEMGNETYAPFFCASMGFTNFNLYYSYLCGSNVGLSGITNVLKDKPGYSICNGHDYFCKMKLPTATNNNTYKVGICGQPLREDYAFKLAEVESGGCTSADDWNTSLRLKYADKFVGTTKYYFDAVIMHTYYDPKEWGNIALGLMPVTSCSGTSDLWHFDITDPRLKPVFDGIIGVGKQPGNFKDFFTQTLTPQNSYKPTFDKMNACFEFNLPAANCGKELWTTEWNLKDHNDEDEDNDTYIAKLNAKKLEIFSNGFINGYLLFQWWLKDFKINFDAAYRPNFYTIATVQNFAGGTTTDLVSLADNFERSELGKNICPYNENACEVMPFSCIYSSNWEERNYHVRRTNYYVAYLMSTVTKNNLKYLSSNIAIGKNNINVPPTIFIDGLKQNAYIYFSNVRSETQNFILNPEGLLPMYPTATQVDLGEATITYLHGQQLYSTSGKGSLYDEDYINACYDTNDHPFEIKSAIEAGVYPAIQTIANTPEYPTEYGYHACVTVPAYSFGYIKVPISGSAPPPKYANPKTSPIALNIYPNPSSTAFFIASSIVSKAIFDIAVIGIDGTILLHTTSSENKPIDITAIAAGCYLVKITDTDKNNYYKKLIKTQ